MPADLRSLCRAYTDATVRIVGGLATGKDTDPEIRLRAIAMLWERGWGKPNQPVTGEDGGDIRITIRNIIEGKS